jgi:hypothetical protein
MALLVLAVQLALGGLLMNVVSRRTAAEGDLRRAALVAAAVAAAIELTGWLIDGTSATATIVAGAASEGRWLFPIGGLLATPGAFLVLAAGRAERAGDLERARRVARRGGFLMAGGAVVAIAAGSSTLLLAGSRTANTFLLWASLTTAAAAGFAGLLAGLAGKPRPTGYLAAALLATSVMTWLATL